MTKAEIVEQVAEQAEISKQDANKAVDAMLYVIQDALVRGSEVSITGFGKFTAAERGARQGVNPQTGERIEIAATRVPRFSPGSQLKKAVRGE